MKFLAFTAALNLIMDRMCHVSHINIIVFLCSLIWLSHNFSQKFVTILSEDGIDTVIYATSTSGILLEEKYSLLCNNEEQIQLYILLGTMMLHQYGQGKKVVTLLLVMNSVKCNNLK